MKQEGGRTILSRQELYELVWIHPVIKLAKQFGVSDVAVAKACRRHGIPVPGRGYWRRLETGAKVMQKSLPKLATGKLDEITFTKGSQVRLGIQTHRDSERKIKVIEEPTELHSLTRQSLTTLSRETKDKRGLTVPDKTLDIRVTCQRLSRAICIM